MFSARVSFGLLLTAASTLVLASSAAVPSVGTSSPARTNIAGDTSTHRRLQAGWDLVACVSDLNIDGIVGVDDLLYLLSAYGRSAVDCESGVAGLNDEIADCGANLQSLNASCAAMLQTATQDIDALNAAAAAAAAENAARLLELQAAVDAAEQECVDTTAELQSALAAEHLVASTAIREACNDTMTSELAAAQAAAQDHCVATTLSLQSTLTAEHEVVTAALQATCDESVISSLAAAQEECVATTRNLQVALAAEHNVSTELLQANCNSTLAQSMAAAQQTCMDTTAALQSALSAEHAAAAAALQAALDRQLAEAQAACTETLQSQENASAQEIAAINAAREQDAARFQQQMRMLHCPTPVVPHADVAGDTAFGGSGMTIVCNDGFADDGVTNTTVSCSTSGEWSPAVPNCVSINPCTNSEDDCDPLADCAHTGPGTHSCECVSGVSFGTGDVCSECTQSCGIGQVATAACTTTSDTVCEAVVGEALPSITGATATYTNGFAYPTTAIYRCDLNSNTMNRTLQPDGSWNAATDLICCGEGEEPGSTGCENCPSGTFSSDGSSCVDCAAGEFSGPAQSACVPPPSGDWLVAAEGVSCPTACNTTNATCNVGDWGVADEASFRAAVGAAGEGADAVCPNGIFGGDNVLLSIGFGSEEGRCYFDDGTSGLFDGCSQPQNASRTVCNCV